MPPQRNALPSATSFTHQAKNMTTRPATQETTIWSDALSSSMRVTRLDSRSATARSRPIRSYSALRSIRRTPTPWDVRYPVAASLCHSVRLTRGHGVGRHAHPFTNPFAPGGNVEPIAGVDEQQAHELGDVQDLHMSEARERSADAREDGSDRDEDVADVFIPLLRLRAITGSRRDRAADEKRRGVRIDEGTDHPHPVPTEHLARQSVRLDQGIVDGRQHDADRSDADGRDQQRREHVRGATLHYQVHGALRERSTAAERAGDVPCAKDWIVPADHGRQRFGDGSRGVEDEAHAPPQQVRAALLRVATQDDRREDQRDDRRGEGDPVDESHSRGMEFSSPVSAENLPAAQPRGRSAPKAPPSTAVTRTPSEARGSRSGPPPGGRNWRSGIRRRAGCRYCPPRTATGCWCRRDRTGARWRARNAPETTGSSCRSDSFR